MFRFKQFTIEQELCAMKVGTDGVLLGAWASGGERVLGTRTDGDERVADGGAVRGPSILDVGSGTGIIALMMAQRFPLAEVTAIDADEGAARQTALNVERSPFADRVMVLHTRVQDMVQPPAHAQHPAENRGQLFCRWQACAPFDAIVCNPPFFIGSLEAPDEQRNMARHAATLTYADLMAAAWRLLHDDGELSVIVPFDYRQRMDDQAIFQGFFPSRVCAVRTVPRKLPRRYLLSFRKHPCRRILTEMTIGDDTYRQLTKEFYLDPPPSSSE